MIEQPIAEVFKFVDPATDLYWTGAFKAPLFVEERYATIYQTRRGADQAAQLYAATREIKSPDLPVLDMIAYRVFSEPMGKVEADLSENFMRPVRFGLVQGADAKVSVFVRQLRDHGEADAYLFIVERRAERSHKYDVDHLHGARLSSRKTGRRFIAVRKDADLVYLRMALGEDYVTAYDMQTGTKIG